MDLLVKCWGCGHILTLRNIEKLEDVPSNLDCPECCSGLYANLEKDWDKAVENSKKLSAEEDEVMGSRSKFEKMPTTTTPTFENKKIEKYLKIVSSHLVYGTNIFFDMFAGVRDIVGGKAQAYQDQLSKLNEEGLSLLKEKAYNLGADAIVGIRFDTDEISGKGKNMFMLNVTGTAVKLKPITE